MYTGRRPNSIMFSTCDCHMRKNIPPKSMLIWYNILPDILEALKVKAQV